MGTAALLKVHTYNSLEIVNLSWLNGSVGEATIVALRLGTGSHYRGFNSFKSAVDSNTQILLNTRVICYPKKYLDVSSLL